MIILDRTIDLFTPLLFQSTYEGMIDEYFGINSTKLHTQIKFEDNQNEEFTFDLTNEDSIFAEIRDKQINQTSVFFQTKIEMLKDFEKKIEKKLNRSEYEKLLKQINDRKIKIEKPLIEKHCALAHHLSNLLTLFPERLLRQLEKSLVGNSKDINPIDLIIRYSH